MGMIIGKKNDPFKHIEELGLAELRFGSVPLPEPSIEDRIDDVVEALSSFTFRMGSGLLWRWTLRPVLGWLRNMFQWAWETVSTLCSTPIGRLTFQFYSLVVALIACSAVALIIAAGR